MQESKIINSGITLKLRDGFVIFRLRSTTKLAMATDTVFARNEERVTKQSHDYINFKHIITALKLNALNL